MKKIIISSTSFLSFSLRFFILQLLRFTMRDWITLPLTDKEDTISWSSIFNIFINPSTTRQTSKQTDNVTKQRNLSTQSTSKDIIQPKPIQTEPVEIKSNQQETITEETITEETTIVEPILVEPVLVEPTVPSELVHNDIKEFIEQAQNVQAKGIHEINDNVKVVQDDEDDTDDETYNLTRTFSSSSIGSSTHTDHSVDTNLNSSIYTDLTTNVKIYWKHGGNKVQVTGEFDHWSVSVTMIKEKELFYVEIPMDLSKDVEYKFVVDGEWKYATDLPHRSDQSGNVNNVIYKKSKN